MREYVAWRILTHEKWRSLLATSGIFIAVVLIFLQLGFYSSVPRGGMLVYSHMRFDILLTSDAYSFQARSGNFPRVRLYQALALPEVASAVPFYEGAATWRNLEDREARRVFIMAFNPQDKIIDAPELVRQAAVLRQPDTVLVDSANKPEFGPPDVGRTVEIGGRAVRIGGTYTLGLGFLGVGVGVTSAVNFSRLFPNQPLTDVNLGLVTLKPGSDAEKVAAALRRLLPPDTRVFTRASLADYEVGYWVKATSTGLIFGFGVIVAFIVGLVILFQILSTQVTRNLKQYATLKAMGFTDRYLGGIVVRQAVLMSVIAFLPALGVALLAYQSTRQSTGLPIYMTLDRVLLVFGVTLVMATGSGLLALRVVRRADPVELF
jgi:putative ABC transport system permease protein